MASVVRWQELVRCVRSSQGTPEPPPAARAILATFKTTGRRPPFGFLPCGIDHEHPDWPESWGPRLPTEVDWTGF
jgi:hypothetical protein